MKEIKLEDISPVAAAEQRITSLFDVLRSEVIDSEEYHVVLFLLSLYKDKVLTEDFLSDNSDLRSILMKGIQDSSEPIVQQYLPIYQIFFEIINRLSFNGFKYLLTEILRVDRKVLSENFSKIFDSVLYQIANSQGRRGGEIVQPVEITRFISSLYKIDDTAKVFNPFAGLASFGISLDQSQNYYGQEINKKTWALGALRLLAYKRPFSSEYVCEDSIVNWPDQSENFDLIVANPPFGMRLGRQYHDVVDGIRRIEHFLITKGINSLNARGKLVALLPESFLFRDGAEREVRKKLVKDDLIDTIILLPGGLLLNTGIPLVILVIDKDKISPGNVRFINAANFVDSKNPKQKILNDYRLNGVVHSSRQNSDEVRIVDYSQIEEFNYNLHVPRYFQEQVDGVKLRDVLEQVKGWKADYTNKDKLVRIGDLKDDKVDFLLEVENVQKSNSSRSELRLIEESCLLFAKRGKALKPTLFEYSGTPILLSTDIFSFKVNEKIVDTPYLINELQTDYVQDQLGSFRLGGTMPIIRRQDLLEVAIKLPSLEEQRAKVQGIVELSSKIENLQKELNTRAHGKATSLFNEFASLKHTLGRPRQNILDWTDNLLHFLSDNPDGFDALNKSFLKFYESDILTALKEIKRDVNFMTDVLEKGENGFVLEEFKLTFISLADINTLVKEYSDDNFNFTIKKLLIKGESLKEKSIYGNKILLRILLDNLLTNANKHGFVSKELGNEVVIELNEIDSYLVIEVKNNGTPFPKNYTQQKFITKYSTNASNSGSGLGGYDINRIATYFEKRYSEYIFSIPYENSSLPSKNWHLILNEDPIYKVIFKFQFPISVIEYL